MSGAALIAACVVVAGPASGLPGGALQAPAPLAAGPWQSPVGEAGALAFARLKALAGEWRGSFSWSGARTDAGAIAARYHLTGGGSALVESLEVGGEPVMTSVYHMDGEDLRLTHYCAAGNQPRLKASAVDLRAGTLSFSFVDATNLKSPEAGHVRAVDLQLEGADRLRLVFTFLASGRESRERIELARAPRVAR